MSQFSDVIYPKGFNARGFYALILKALIYLVVLNSKGAPLTGEIRILRLSSGSMGESMCTETDYAPKLRRKKKSGSALLPLV
jgi:hypothetical protein